MRTITRSLIAGLIALSMTLAIQSDADAQYPVAIQPVAPAVVGYTAERRGLFGRRVVLRPVVSPVPVAPVVTAARPVIAAPVTMRYAPQVAPVVTTARPVITAPVTMRYAPQVAPVTVQYAPAAAPVTVQYAPAAAPVTVQYAPAAAPVTVQYAPAVAPVAAYRVAPAPVVAPVRMYRVPVYRVPVRYGFGF